MPGLTRLTRLLLVLAGPALTGLAGCATPPAASDPAALADYHQNNDPLEPTNRVFYAVDDTLDTYVLAPVARGYRAVVPEAARTGVHNVLSNLGSPARLANDALQAKPRAGGDNFMRFVINSTLGVAGVFDVAGKLGYPAHDTDFGVTLALWDVPSGPYLFLPALGPSNPRDTGGYIADAALDPFTYIAVGTTGWQVFSYSRTGLTILDERTAHLDDIAQLKANALDPYATFRSLFQQNRAAQITGARQDGPHTVPIWFPQPAKTAP